MVPLQYIIQQRTASFPEDRLLRGTLIEHSIEVHLEYFVLKIQSHSMIYQFEASFRELISEGSVTNEYFYLACVLVLVYVLGSAHLSFLQCKSNVIFYYSLIQQSLVSYFQEKELKMYIKQSARAGMLLSNKSSQSVNTIAKNKKQSESDFRVHFTLMNVSWKIRQSQKQKQQKLIDYIYAIINDICRVHIVQIADVIDDDVYDVSVGLANDGEACEFLRKRVPVVLADGAAKEENQYVPIISRVFQSYIKKMEKNKDQFGQTMLPPSFVKASSTQSKSNKHMDNNEQFYMSMQMEKKNSVAEPLLQKRKSITELPKGQKPKQKKQQQEEKQKQINRIWAFGIPKQFTIPQIKQSLKKSNIETGQCKWRVREHMQYLDISLLKPIAKNKVYYLGLQIDGFPYIPIPMGTESQICRQLSRYTIQIITRPSYDDEDRFIRSMSEIGGVNVMLRTPVKERDDFRYLVVFNSVDKAERACRVAKNVKECVVQRKQYELKVGRVNKFYTFTCLYQQFSQYKL